MIENNVYILGRAMYSVLDGFGAFKNTAAKMLEEGGIGERNEQGQFTLQLNKWYYNQAAFIGVFKKIGEKMGDTQLRSIGQKVPQNAEFPPWVSDIHSAIKSVDIAYHMSHSKDGQKPMFDPETGKLEEGIGHYGYQPIEGEKRIISVCDNPYPTSFDNGILSAIASKFEPTARVVLDESKPSRRDGADSDTFIITWI